MLIISNYYHILRSNVFVCSGLTSLSTLYVISRRCLVVTGSSMLTFIVLPIPDTFTCYHLQSHYTDTGATSPSPTPKIRVPSGEQLVPLLTTLVCRGPGSNPVSPDLGADTLPTELPRPVKVKFN